MSWLASVPSQGSPSPTSQTSIQILSRSGRVGRRSQARPFGQLERHAECDRRAGQCRRERGFHDPGTDRLQRLVHISHAKRSTRQGVRRHGPSGRRLSRHDGRSIPTTTDATSSVAASTSTPDIVDVAKSKGKEKNSHHLMTKVVTHAEAHRSKVSSRGQEAKSRTLAADRLDVKHHTDTKCPEQSS
jgi:hypothetical protein